MDVVNEHIMDLVGQNRCDMGFLGLGIGSSPFLFENSRLSLYELVDDSGTFPIALTFGSHCGNGSGTSTLNFLDLHFGKVLLLN